MHVASASRRAGSAGRMGTRKEARQGESEHDVIRATGVEFRTTQPALRLPKRLMSQEL